VHFNEFQPPPDEGRDILQILQVLAGDDDLLYTGPEGGQGFFL
jgi:hypothetical protein